MRNLFPWILFLVATGCGSDESGPAGSTAGAGGSAQSDGSTPGKDSGTTGGTGGGSGTGGSSTGGSSGSSGASGTGGTTGTGGSGGAGGIACKYPGDVGIEADPDVIFADGFETYAQASELRTKWDNFFQAAQTRIVTDAANVWTGQKALEFTLPQQTTELSNARTEDPDHRARRPLPALLLEVRKHVRRLGLEPQRRRHQRPLLQRQQATPGVPANGTNKFLIEFESWRGKPRR